MNQIGKYKMIAGLFMVLVSFNAWAADDSAANNGMSETTQSALLDKLYVNYFATVHGPAINNLNSPYTVDHNGNQAAFPGINFDSEITTAYMVNSDFGVGPDVPFQFAPVLGQGIILGDLGVKAFNHNTVKFEGFELYTNLYLQAPTSKYSQSRNEVLGIKMTPYVRYHLTGTRFTFGAWTEEKMYAGVSAGTLYKLYFQPYANYKLSSALSLNVGWETEFHHNVGDPGMSFATYETDLQPGFVWMITPKVMVNPYLQVFTQNQISTDRMALGAVISATVL